MLDLRSKKWKKIIKRRLKCVLKGLIVWIDSRKRQDNIKKRWRKLWRIVELEVVIVLVVVISRSYVITYGDERISFWSFKLSRWCEYKQTPRESLISSNLKSLLVLILGL